jgi:peptidoglycan/LPS O-acetylase OafA/YrhL
MNWDPLDYAVAGALIAGAAAVFGLALRKGKGPTYRLAVGVALAAAVMLVWVNAAVGIIGDEGNDANLMYFGVLAIAMAGAALARFRPRGMALALAATALAQLVVAVIALVTVAGAEGPAWPADLLVATGFFAALWLLSAGMFWRSGSPAH